MRNSSPILDIKYACNTNPATYLVLVLLRLARIYAPAALLIRWISLLRIGKNEINGISQHMYCQINHYGLLLIHEERVHHGSFIAQILAMDWVAFMGSSDRSQ